MKQEESNAFDDLDSGHDHDEALRQKVENTEVANRFDYLIHKIFEQTPEGKELMVIWDEILRMSPTVVGGMDMYDVGMREGRKTFIRDIILTVRRVERGE